MKNMKLKKILPLVGVAGTVVTTPILATSCGLSTGDPGIDDAITPDGDINTDGDTNTGTKPENPDNGNGEKPDVNKTILDLSKYSNEIKQAVIEKTNTFKSKENILGGINDQNSLAKLIYDAINSISYDFENTDNKKVFSDVIVKHENKLNDEKQLLVSIELKLNQDVNFTNLDELTGNDFTYEPDTSILKVNNEIPTNIIVIDATVIQKYVSTSLIDLMHQKAKRTIETSSKIMSTENLNKITENVKSKLVSEVFNGDESFIKNVNLIVDETNNKNVNVSIEFNSDVKLADLSNNIYFGLDSSKSNTIKTKTSIEVGLYFIAQVSQSDLDDLYNSATSIMFNTDVSTTSKETLIQNIKDELFKKQIEGIQLVKDVELISAKNNLSTENIITDTEVKLLLTLDYDHFVINDNEIVNSRFEPYGDQSKAIKIISKDIITIGSEKVQTLSVTDIDDEFYNRISDYLSKQSPDFFPINFANKIKFDLNNDFIYKGKKNIVENVVVTKVNNPQVETVKQETTNTDSSSPIYTKPESTYIDILIQFNKELVQLEDFQENEYFSIEDNNSIKSKSPFEIGKNYKPMIELNDLSVYEDLIKSVVEFADPNSTPEEMKEYENYLKEELNRKSIKFTKNLIKNVTITKFDDANQDASGWEYNSAKVSLEFNAPTDQVRYDFDKNYGSNFVKNTSKENTVDYGIILKMGLNRPSILSTDEVEGNFYNTLKDFLDKQDPTVPDSKLASNLKYFLNTTYSLDGKQNIVKNIEITRVNSSVEGVELITNESQDMNTPIVQKVDPIDINLKIEFDLTKVKVNNDESKNNIFEYAKDGIFTTKNPIKVGTNYKPTVTLYDLNNFGETIKENIRYANPKLSVEVVEEELKNQLNAIEINHVSNLVKDVEIEFATESDDWWNENGQSAYVILDLHDSNDDFVLDLMQKGLGSSFKRINDSTKVVFNLVLSYGSKSPASNQ